MALRFSLVRSSMAGYTLLLGVSLGVAYAQGRLDRGWVLPGTGEIAAAIAFGLGLGGAVLGVGALLRSAFLWARRLDTEFQVMLAPLGAREAMALAVASGVAEEAFFRGTLQPHMGIVLTSLAFGLLHYPLNRRMIPWTGIAIAMGFVLGWSYEVTGSLLAVTLAHAMINFVELRRIGGDRSSGPARPPSA